MTEMKSVLILGAGTAGMIVANKLARELRREIARGEVAITALDRSVTSTNPGGLTFIPFGLLTGADITAQKSKLISPRVAAVFGSAGDIKRVDLENRKVTTTAEKTYGYDYLVIATGYRLDAGAVRGLSKDFNSFYTSLEDAQKLGARLRSFEKGRIVVLVPAMPITCPGAPGKFSVLLADYMKYVRGEETRKNVEIELLWPGKTIGPPVYNALLDRTFQDKGIAIRKEFAFQEVDETNKEVVSAKGEKVKYDFLVVVPPNRGIQPLMDSGITDEKGWIPTDKLTLQYAKSPKERHDEVYAIGDCGNPEILKTGVGAHFQGFITAQNIINDLQGLGVKSLYRGETGCPFVGSMYTPSTKGTAYIPAWTYTNPPGPFVPTEAGWLFYRMFYYTYWGTVGKGLL